MQMKFLYKTIFVFAMLLAARAWADFAAAEQHVQEAWNRWMENDQAGVEENFRAALAEDSANARAHLGLAFLYSLQQKDEAAWQAFTQALKYVDDPYPYVFAAWASIRLSNDKDGRYPAVAEFWEKLSEKADPGGMLRAAANQFLGEYYEQRGDLAQSRQHYRAINAIKDWTTIGPFDNISASGFDKALPPEKEYKFDKIYDGKNGVPAKWFKIAEVRPDYWIDFRRYFAFEQAVYYANTFVYSPRKQGAQIRIGTSGSLKAFLNDQLIIEYFDENNNDLDTYIAETELQKGWNRLLVKVGYSEIDRCNFMARITDARGEPLPGLQISTASHSYPRSPRAPVKSILNFAESYFQKKVAENPAHLENYLLLADCYLRNDKAIEGELALREAIKRAPNCALLHTRLIEAYARGEKFDDLATTIEKIYTLDKNVPQVLEYKFHRYLENEQIDKAEEMLQRLESLIPATPGLYQNYLTFYSAKRQVEKIIETAKTGYQLFPFDWQLASTQAMISIQTSRTYGEAVDIYRDFLSRQYLAAALSTLAETYLKASAVDLWEQTYPKLIELDSAAAGYHFSMGSTYFSLQRYADAERSLLKAIEICPNSSEYRSKLAEVYRTNGAPEKARDAYREALKYNPANYDAREKLRELDGKEPVFSQFESVDIDSLVRNAPAAEQYPDNGAVILLNDLKRVVYRQGASETAEEFLVKVFSNRGIDDFKEYWINYNGYTEGLTVEKAVVIKQDGAEIAADVNRNQVVFKSLEKEDFIYLKWRIKNYYTGKLSNHFWDQFFFNGFYPIEDIRYSLLAPEDFKFRHAAQNMPGEPAKTKTGDGIIYRWRLAGEPAIVYEYGMPLLDDVGKVLHISSIEDWEYMVEWYSDIAKTKARSSFEIKEQVEKLFAGNPGASAEEKVQTIYNFITENIRYSSVPFRQSGLIPQPAREVLVTRIGDCKDMATLCIAMLEEVGIDAHYVLVNTRDEGSNRNALPSIAFNHCIAAVETGQGIRYLDLTANNYPYGSAPDMDLQGFSLLIKPGVTAPEYLQEGQFSPRNVIREMKISIQEDNGVEVEKTNLKSGSQAASLRSHYREQARGAIEKSLLETLSDDFPEVRVLHFRIDNLDEVNAPIRYSYTFSVPDYVAEVGSFKFLKIPWSERLSTDKALSYEERRFPYNLWPAADTLREEVEIYLPPGCQPLELGENVQLSNPVADYSLTFSREGGVIKGRREMVYKKSVVSPEEYREFRAFYNRALKADNRQILLKRVEGSQ